MGCPHANTLVAFLEGGIAAASAAELEDHLASCATCRRLAVEYAAIGPARIASRVEASAAPALDAAPVAAAADDLAERARRLARAHASRRIGSVLDGKWRVDRVIGIGGMGQVFAATHRNGRSVAIKVMRVDLAVDPSLVERFLREGYVANKVGHPGAVAVLDDDLTDDGAPFLVMELLEGRSLRERVEAEGALPADEALRLTHDLLDVLAAAHAQGIVHRDIKPDNLFETQAGQLKVLDFGIARVREQAADSAAFTQSGVTIGTLGYMAPEQARGQATVVDARTDLWAVGATLFTLLTSRVLHGAGTANEALLLSMTTPVPPAASLAPGLPAPVCALLDTALAFDKAARFPDARAMQRAVTGARADPSTRVSAPLALQDTLLAAGQGPTLLALSAPKAPDPGTATPAVRALPTPGTPARAASGAPPTESVPATKWLVGSVATALAIGAAAVIGVAGKHDRAAAVDAGAAALSVPVSVESAVAFPVAPVVSERAESSRDATAPSETTRPPAIPGAPPPLSTSTRATAGPRTPPPPPPPVTRPRTIETSPHDSPSALAPPDPLSQRR